METKKGYIPCTNCDIPYEGNFCPNCGEKRFTSHSLSLAHHAEETLEGLTHFDNKFFRTIKTLVTKPGEISLDNVQGRTVRFVKAFQLFLIINLIVFMVPIFNPFSLPLHSYVTYTPFTNYGTKEAVKKEVETRNISYKEYEAKFNERMHATSKGYIILFIPLYALLFSLFFFNTKKRFGEHLVFATHFMSFVLIIFLFMSLIIEGLILAAVSLFGYKGYVDFDGLMVVSLALILFTYLFFSIRRFYQPGILQNILTTICTGVGMFFLLQIYRMFIFYKIIWFS